MPRPLRATIDLSALQQNLNLAQRRARRSRVMAVVKADAYGHGLRRVFDAVSSADGLAVVELERAVELRELGYLKPILLLEGYYSADDVPLIEEHQLDVVVHSAEQLAQLHAFKGRARVGAFLKVNCGMNRLGFRPEELGAAFEALKKHPAISSITLMAHFACADEQIGIGQELHCFAAASAGYSVPRSLANSAALLRYPSSHSDWVRPGIMLYGSSPFSDQSAEAIGLRPVMTLSSELISVRSIRAGERVGYGGVYVAQSETRVGVVACGYADGYPRQAPLGTPILVDGIRTQIIGRVSMDMLCVDLQTVPQARVGSRVVLWGDGLPIDEVAQAASTVSYELFCALAPRVPVTAY